MGGHGSPGGVPAEYGYPQQAAGAGYGHGYGYGPPGPVGTAPPPGGPGYGYPPPGGPGGMYPPPPQPPNTTRRNVLIAVGAVVATGAVVAGIAAASSGGSDGHTDVVAATTTASVSAPPSRVPAPTLTPPSPAPTAHVPTPGARPKAMPYVVLTPGTCFDTPTLSPPLALSPSVARVTPRTCASAHDAQVVANETLPAGLSSDVQVQSAALRLCTDDARAHLPADGRMYYPYALFPNLGTYRLQHRRTVTCSLTLNNGTNGRKLYRPLG